MVTIQALLGFGMSSDVNGPPHLPSPLFQISRGKCETRTTQLEGCIVVVSNLH
jgi:hypothetical protein